MGLGNIGTDFTGGSVEVFNGAHGVVDGFHCFLDILLLLNYRTG